MATKPVSIPQATLQPRLIPCVVVDVRERTAGRQQVVGIADFERFEFPAHAPVLFDRRLQPFLERIDTVFVIAGRVMA